MKTEYTTRNGNGTVEITKGVNSYMVSFDGLQAIPMKFSTRDGKTIIGVKLNELFAVGFNCPNQDVLAAIVLPKIKDHKAMLSTFVEKSLKGKYCGDGLWRSYEELNRMNYTEKVLSGESGE